MVDVNQVLSFMAENTLRTGLPVPAPKDVAYRWAKPLELPSKGEVFLYTGVLYQLVPYINSLVKQLEQLEKKPVGGVVLRLAKAVAKVVDLSKIAVKPEKSEVEASESILRSIAGLLRRAGVEYAYLYEDDMYSGVILYDMGLEEAFQKHAERVHRRLTTRGARKLITIDPHTTHVLRDIYPRYVDGFSLEVVNYLELLDEAVSGGRLRAKTKLGEAMAIHDPCLYARALDIIAQPRRLLEAAGVEVLEPRRSGKLTYCCGGPVEALSPRLAERIASTRLSELTEKSKSIITMCPICYANLSRAASGDTRITDISIILAKAFIGEAGRP